MILGLGRPPLEQETEAHSSILAWEIQRTESLAGYSLWSRKRVRHDLATKQQHRVYNAATDQAFGSKDSYYPRFQMRQLRLREGT